MRPSLVGLLGSPSLVDGPDTSVPFRKSQQRGAADASPLAALRSLAVGAS
jgi:hypothetical protein